MTNLEIKAELDRIVSKIKYGKSTIEEEYIGLFTQEGLDQISEALDNLEALRNKIWQSISTEI